ncbi:mandelate racemase [Baekduia soli]|uniref:Mandelate racemase n=1 Tax=Baekduia soli TaxID=496014 RepID=A0A5B8U371_9ACTN|nr:enolase C-terminal domain-like protein [Baekduia soli]QEC47420.1 mandelate racemase [Baekduia soli]
MSGAAVRATVGTLDVTVCTVPTDAPESDGTLAWDATTVVLVEAHGGGCSGLGLSYGPPAIAAIIEGQLAAVVAGRPVLDVPASWLAMRRAVRNFGGVGPSAMAISAVDVALWDLAAQTLELPLCSLLGRVHDRVPIYGSGGFCSYSDARLARQLGGWAADGIGRVKMKLGREPERDRQRLQVARDAIGPDVELFVDANGAFDRNAALGWAEVYAGFDVRYFEEPVSSDDLQGLALLRRRAPGGMAIAAGEYGFDLPYFRDMVTAVDVQQADVTRCGGITGLLRVGALCQAHQVPFSAHCAPAISAHACTAVQPLAHLEYFHDHVRLESMLFDGTLSPQEGCLVPDLDRPGLGLRPRREVIARFAQG